MNIRDIRIGNLIIDKETSESGIIGEVVGTNCFTDQITIFTKHEGVTDRYDIGALQAYGIPISEDWLVKLGFSRKDYKEGHIGIDFKTKSLHSDFALRIEEFGIIYELREYFIVTLEYVHELQNLFHVITSQELTIKEGKGE